MDPKIIGAFGLLCLCSISSSIAASMGGGEEKPDAGAGAGTPAADAAPETPTRAKYETYLDHDFSGNDIACSTDEATACEAKCDANDKCVSYIHTAEDNVCCIKNGTQNYVSMPDRKITAYIKNIDGYEVKGLGDRPSGDIERMSPGTLPTCKAKCDSLDNCIGFNFGINDGINNCWIKKADGISQTYSLNGHQFYTKM